MDGAVLYWHVLIQAGDYDKWTDVECADVTDWIKCCTTVVADGTRFDRMALKRIRQVFICLRDDT